MTSRAGPQLPKSAAFSLLRRSNYATNRTTSPAKRWIEAKVGYEIPFTRHFYIFTPPRPLAEIDAEIKQLEAEIQSLLAEVT